MVGAPFPLTYPRTGDFSKGGRMMPETAAGPRVGQKVPSFEIETYDPVRGDFGTISLGKLMAEGRWTILFFYPADFTFV